MTKEERKIYMKEYYLNNKIKFQSKSKIGLSDYQKKYYQKNKEKLKEYRKEYYKANKDTNKIYQIQYIIKSINHGS